MKWEKVLATANKEVYVLSNNNKKLLTLDFHPFTNAARIEYAAEKRVFMIRKEGFLRNKTVLCNEYGVRMGQLLSENKETVIELNNEKFAYTIQNNPQPELVIYKESREQPLMVCGINVDNSGSGEVQVKDRTTPNAQSSLLLALCWYMLLPVAQENKMQVLDA